MANHRRLDILFLVSKNPGITVEGIAEKLQVNFKTISAHTRKLFQVGLINKEYRGQAMSHVLSPYGKKVLTFIKTF